MVNVLSVVRRASGLQVARINTVMQPLQIRIKVMMSFIVLSIFAGKVIFYCLIIQ